MKQTAILAIDQGTTNTKALLVDAAGNVLARASRPVQRRYPRPAWVEQDPLELWQSVLEASTACLEQGGANVELVAVAISNQRESVLLWERASGRPLGPCVSWQCQRSRQLCQSLQDRGLEPFIRERSGLTLDPMFSGTKIRWLLEEQDLLERAEAGELCAGTVDSWLCWQLSGGAAHICDMTNASRTQLFNLGRRAWDEELLQLLGVPAAILPVVEPSAAIHARTVACGALPAGLPIAALIGDSHAALFGQAGFLPGAVKATYGTGSSLMTPVPEPRLSQSGLSTTIAWAIGERVTYALEGNIYVTGAAVEWLGRFLGLSDPVVDLAALAASVPDSGGLYFVPALSGLGAPYWDKEARGLICGLTQASTLPQLARATVEAIAYQVRAVFDAMQAEAGVKLQVLLADGGATRNDLLMQFQADIIGKPVLRCESADVSALGAAYLAGLAVGLWANEEEIAALPRPRQRFTPTLPAEAREARYSGWQEAVARTTLHRSAGRREEGS
ncbi:FGGY family carbohydrate kinase [Thermogemmatispora carboxidivorans]|uniref:FGGY family carbohydrate kinase n=1 Tax=Thermogemmatispora carboxidivorans TaxID=1382306 RepID=UPI00069B4D2C|nr:glycerol kinase GlpK [Thermogemmatispora carboxidivorans]